MIDEGLIASQNPWWVSPARINGDEKVAEALSKRHRLVYGFSDQDPENTLFFGPRQTGKSTFFKLLIKDLIDKGTDPRKIMYFSCEPLKGFEEIIELMRKSEGIAQGLTHVFLDEISFVEDWQRAIKFILDSGMKNGKIIYMTGSSSLNLKKESFPGRPVKVKEFMPLSFRDFCGLFCGKELKAAMKFVADINDPGEIRKAASSLVPHQAELDRLFRKYLDCGGFPRPMFELMEGGGIRDETYEIYWKWLVYDMTKLGKSAKITTGLFSGILRNYKSKSSLNSLAKDIEIASHVTVREYLEVLEGLCAVRSFYTFDVDKKRVVFRKMRKVYFTDPFLFHVTGRQAIGSEKTDDYSGIVEGVVAEAISRCAGGHAMGAPAAGFYHATGSGREIDVCFGETGIEVKWQNSVKPSDFPAANVKNRIIVSKSEFELDPEAGIIILPAPVFLAIV
jgi:hypothetical protein